jgi:hypothetical protein
VVTHRVYADTVALPSGEAATVDKARGEDVVPRVACQWRQLSPQQKLRLCQLHRQQLKCQWTQKQLQATATEGEAATVTTAVANVPVNTDASS